MTATKHIPAVDADQQVALGTYRRDGVDHQVRAVRGRGAPWQLIDVTGHGATVVESFFLDEELESAQALAELYLAEMRA